jgi:tetratricopeptide (TPR) repeat protein
MCLPASGQAVDQAMIYLKKGNILFAKGDLDGAMANFNKAIELKPTLAAAYLYRGYTRRAQGALDQAIEDYDRATELDPRTTLKNRQVAQAYINHGQINKNKLEAEVAINAYNKAIKLYPDELHAYLERGEARILLEDFQGALADFNYLLGIKDHDEGRTALAYACRSFVKLLLGQEDEAKKDLAESLKLGNKNKMDINSFMRYLEVQLLMMRRVHPQKKKEKVT